MTEGKLIFWSCLIISNIWMAQGSFGIAAFFMSFALTVVFFNSK